MAVSNEVLLRQARSELARAKGKHKTKWQAEVARLEALVNPPLVPEPTPLVTAAEPPPPVTAVQPPPPSVRVKGKGGRPRTGSSHQRIRFVVDGPSNSRKPYPHSNRPIRFTFEPRPNAKHTST